MNRRKEGRKGGSLILPNIPNTLATLVNSVGQISGQWMNPKYTSRYFPLKSVSETTCPLWSIKVNAAPTRGFPTEYTSTDMDGMMIMVQII